MASPRSVALRSSRTALRMELMATVCFVPCERLPQASGCGYSQKPVSRLASVAARTKERRSLLRNGDRFFIFGENGDLVIARLSPEKYDG